MIDREKILRVVSGLKKTAHLIAGNAPTANERALANIIAELSGIVEMLVKESHAEE